MTSVPVTLRSLVPAPNPAYGFTGTLTGGNGRESKHRADRLLPDADPGRGQAR